MTRTLFLIVAVGLAGGLLAPVAAQDKPVVAMIGTGTLADTFGPAIDEALDEREPDDSMCAGMPMPLSLTAMQT